MHNGQPFLIDLPDRHLLQTLGYGFWLVGGLVALVFGRTPERIAGVALLADLATAVFYHDPKEIGGVFWHLAAGDILVLLVLGVLLARYHRPWLVWAVGAAALAVVAHIPRLIDPTIRNYGYATVEAVLGYILVVTVAAGALMQGRRHARR